MGRKTKVLKVLNKERRKYSDVITCVSLNIIINGGVPLDIHMTKIVRLSVQRLTTSLNFEELGLAQKGNINENKYTNRQLLLHASQTTYTRPQSKCLRKFY